MRFSPVQRLNVDCEKKSENVTTANDVAGEKQLLSAKNDAKTGNCEPSALWAGRFVDGSHAPALRNRQASTIQVREGPFCLPVSAASFRDGRSHAWNRRSMAEKTGKAS
jgi:hypothetical protein